MSSLFGSGYDPRGQARAEDFGNPLPRGKYPVEITKAEEQNNKAGTGAFLFVEHTVLSQQYKGRKVFHRFNLRNQSQKAEEIARKEFNSLLDAVGMGDVIIKSPSQLLGKVFLCRVDVEERDGREDNVVKGWEDKGNLAPASAQPAAGAPVTPAWQRSAPAAAMSSAHHNGGAAGQSGPTDAGTGTAHAAVADTTTQQTTAHSDAPQRPKKPWEK